MSIMASDDATKVTNKFMLHCTGSGSVGYSHQFVMGWSIKNKTILGDMTRGPIPPTVGISQTFRSVTMLII